MSDEANAHYYSFIEQLLHGHQWLLNHLGYKPRLGDFLNTNILIYLLQFNSPLSSSK